VACPLFLELLTYRHIVIRVLPPPGSTAFALTWYCASPNLVLCFTLILFASTTVCCAGRPATCYGAARDPPPPPPACRQLSSARNACAGSSSEESVKLQHGTKLGRTRCYQTTYVSVSFTIKLHLYTTPAASVCFLCHTARRHTPQCAVRCA